MKTRQGDQRTGRPPHAGLCRHQQQADYGNRDRGKRPGNRRVAPGHQDVGAAVTVSLYRPIVSGNAGGWPDPQQLRQGNRLAPDEWRVAKAVQGGPAGAALVEIHQGETAGVIPVPAQLQRAVQARQQGQQEQQHQVEETAPARQRRRGGAGKSSIMGG